MKLTKNKACLDPEGHGLCNATIPEQQQTASHRGRLHQIRLHLAVDLLGRYWHISPRQVFQLITNLGLSRATPEVEAILRQRAEVLGPETELNIYATNAMFSVSGMQFGKDNGWRLSNLLKDEAVRNVVDTATGDVIGLVCSNAAEGDWILQPAAQDLKNVDVYHSLVARPVGSRLAFVGLAAMSSNSTAGPSKFRVCLDAPDYVTWLACMRHGPQASNLAPQTLSTSARLNVNVCHTALSSYAISEPPANDA